MAFPINPNDGDTYTADSGVQYVYSLANDSWTVVSGYTLYGQTGAQGTDGSVTGALNFVMDGGDQSVTGLQGNILVPFDMTFYEWSILAGQTGSITLDLYKDSYANFPPTNDDSMPGSGKEPTITDSIKGQTGISGWASNSASNGDIIQVYCESVDTIRQATLTLRFRKD